MISILAHAQGLVYTLLSLMPSTVIGILVYFLLVWLNEGTLEWSGNPFGGWKTALIFLIGGAITGAATGKALDLYCERVERRLIQLERDRVERETTERERIEREVLERKKQERENQEIETLDPDFSQVRKNA